MAIINAPFLPLWGFWRDKARIEAVYSFDGQTYYLRQLGRYVFYHLEGEDTIEQTRFVCCDSLNGVSNWPSKIKAESLSRRNRPLPVEGENVIPEPEVKPYRRKPHLRAGKSFAQDAIYPEAGFAAQVRSGESGRYALHQSNSYRACNVAFFLRQNGTGTCLHHPHAFFSG